jgi:hypothetical protein
MFTRVALKEGGDAQRFSQCIRATNSDELSDGNYPLLGTKPFRLNFPGAATTLPVFMRYKL